MATASPDPRWAATGRLFDELLPLSVDQRHARLVDQPPDLAAEVAELLQQHDALEAEGGSFLGLTPQLPTGPDGAALRHADRAGQRLGPWRLVSRLGAGGMGEVWLAERADGQYTGQAAVKLLRASVRSARVQALFAQERQLLAQLDHPHIARLLDAGTTEQGQPYLVMERVAGRPIDEALRGQPLARRLAAMLQLTDAVAYAHRQRLLHRDLKPRNVMVTPDGEVKLLDFGIAKVLDAGMTDAATATMTGERPFTPHYASPEQVRGEALGPTSDVYALGVMLYELLTGSRPLGRAAHSAADAVLAVLHERACPPSQLPPAEARDPHWAELRTQVAGDLDHVVMKALEPDAARRYASAADLAADLRAVIERRPVQARSASRLYRLSRLVQRQRWMVLAVAVGLVGVALAVASASLQGQSIGALGFVALAAGLALAVWQNRRAEAARSHAERHVRALRRLASRIVFEYHDGIRHLQGSTAVRESMLADAQDYLREVEEAAEADPRLAYDLARMAHRLALLSGAMYSEGLEQTGRSDEIHDRALRLVRRACVPAMRDATVLLECASIVADAAEFDQRLGRLAPGPTTPAGRDALSGLQEARQLVERARLVDSAHPHLYELLGTFDGRLGRILGSGIDVNLARWNEAGPHLQASVAHMRQYAQAQGHSAEGHRQLAWALAGLAGWQRLAGSPTDAVDTAREAQAQIDSAVAAEPAHAVYPAIAANLRSHLAAALGASGRLDEAAALMHEVLAANEQALRTSPDNAVLARDQALLRVSFGRLLVDGGRPQAAMAELRAGHERLLQSALAADDAYLGRWCAEAGLLRARAELEAEGDAAAALARADHEAQRVRELKSLSAARQVAEVLLAQAEVVAGAALAALGQTDAAIQRWERAVRHLDAAAPHAPAEPLPRALAMRRQAVIDALRSLQTHSQQAGGVPPYPWPRIAPVAN